MTKALKIAITADPEIPVPPVFYGGIERIIFMLIEELVKQGHDVTLFAHKDSKVPCKLVPYPGLTQSNGDVIKNSFIITSKILFGRFDVVHSFGRLAYLTFLMPFSLRKVMSYQREPTISQIKLAKSLAGKGSLVFTGCSEYIAGQIRPFASSYAIHNFVDSSKYTFNGKVAADAPLVFLGRIEHIKGTHVAIEIAKKTNRKLIIAGNVPQEPEQLEYFNTKVKPHIDDDQIQYVGPVNDEQKNILLQSSYAFLMPILWNEPFGIVMAEALACGTPIIGFNRGAVPEIVEDGKNGYRVENTDEMIGAIKNIDKINRVFCRKTAEEKFDVSVITKKYIHLYAAN